jgi:hypothetical protein
MSACAAATDYELDPWHFCEHPSDRIRNGAIETTRITGLGDADNCLGGWILWSWKELYPGLSARWKGGPDDLRGRGILGTVFCCWQNGICHCQSGYKTTCTAQHYFHEGKVIRAQPCRDGRKQIG